MYSIAGYKIRTLGSSALVHPQASYDGFLRNVTKSLQMSLHFTTSETLDVALDEYKIFIKVCQAISSQD